MSDINLDALRDALIQIFLKSYKDSRYLHGGELCYRLSQETGYPVSYIKREINAMVKAGVVIETVDDNPTGRFMGKPQEVYLGTKQILEHSKIRQEKLHQKIKEDLGRIL